MGRQHSPKLTQGQSQRFTLFKELGLAAVFATSLRRKPWAKPFRFVDLNAGCGWNQRAGVKGSPLVFLETAEFLCAAYFADFVERDMGSAAYLSRIIGSRWKSCRVHNLDNREAQDAIGLSFRDQGLYVVDPNSYKGIPSPISLNNLPPGMDLCISWNSGSVKRALSHSSLNPQKLYGPIPALKTFLCSVMRKNWQIRQPLAGDIHQWTMLVGSNLDLYDQPSDGFFRLRSPMGQRILKFCSEPSSGKEFPDVVYPRARIASAEVVAA